MSNGLLGDNAEILSGFAFKSIAFNTDGRGMPLVRIRDVVPGRTSTFYDGPYDDRFVVQDGDVLIGMDGDFNRARWSGGSALLNQRVCKVSAHSNLDDRYLFHLLPEILQIISDRTPFVTVKHLSARDLRETKIPLPPLKEQRRIAAILDQADALRRLRRRALDRLNTLGQAIFHEMFGDPVTNPQGWEKIKLGDLCDVGSSKRVYVNEFVENGVPFYRGTEVGKLALGKKILPDLFITHEHYEGLIQQSGRPKLGDLLLPSICHDGRIWRVNSEDPFYFKDGRVLWIKSHDREIDGEYLRNHLRNTFLHNYNSIASGTTFAELKIVNLKSLHILNPPIELQRNFSKIIRRVESNVTELTRSEEDLGSLFSSLQNRAFQGEL